MCSPNKQFLPFTFFVYFVNKTKIHSQMIEKSDTIKELQERLDLAQKRLQQNVSETSSQGYVNIKAMQDRLRQDQVQISPTTIYFYFYKYSLTRFQRSRL